jgi:hypothetical protein
MTPQRAQTRSPLLSLVFAGSVLLLAACGDEEWRGDGTVAMADRLAELAREVESQSHPYAMSASSRSESLDEPADTPEGRIAARAMEAREAMRSGRPEEAVEELQTLVSDLSNLGSAVSPGLRLAIVESLGLAHMRVWGRENCLAGGLSEPCLFPLEPRDGSAQDHARSAVEIYHLLTDGQPDNLALRWLLNLSHMMVGDYPEGVPEAHLIPPDRAGSEYPLPRFPDVAGALGVDEMGHAGGAIMDDLDRDGDLDLIASSWHLRDQLRLYRNDGPAGFTDITYSAGLRGITGGLNLAQADYDNDGWLDILVLRGAWTSYGEPNSLLRNNGDGTFEDVTEAAGLLAELPTQAGAWGDFDNDGWLDLFVGHESQPDRTIPSQLFRNNGDGTFTEMGAAVGAGVVGFVKAAVWGDVDNDGWQDLYVSRLSQPNVLLRNQGPGPDGLPTFAEITERAGVAEPLASFPSWFWDYDNDGWLDIFVSGYQGTVGDLAAEYLGLPHAGETPRLYRNLGDGRFQDVTVDAAMARVLLTMGSNFGDLDNDGFEDLYLGTGEANLQTIVPNRMFRNDRGQSFQEVTAPGGFGHLGKGHGVAFGDLDRDGDQDVYIGMGGAFEADLARNSLFENPGSSHGWLTLELEGRESNRSAIGARIRVRVATSEGAREFHRVVGGGSSFGANSLLQEVGLGAATRIEFVEVAWPASGRVDRYDGLALNSAYRIVEGSPEAEPLAFTPIQFPAGTP